MRSPPCCIAHRCVLIHFFFFFQAEDGIRDLTVTGVQTCALPICNVTMLGSGFSQPIGVAVDGSGNVFVADYGNNAVKEILAAGGYNTVNMLGSGRSGERRVGEEGRSRGVPDHLKKKKENMMIHEH